MTIVGYALSCEEFHPCELARQPARAQRPAFWESKIAPELAASA